MSSRQEQPSFAPARLGGMAALHGEGEARRNRLLRRIDWRFLMGKARPRCSLAPAGMLAEALSLVSEQIETALAGQPGRADAAALVNPTQRDLEQAWLALEPGGVLYVEEYRPRPGGPARLRACLEQAGFLPGPSFWPWPLPERAAPAFWLPLESPQALEYFLESRPSAPTAFGRLKQASLRAGWRAARQSGILAPVCMAAYKPGSQGARSGPPAQSLQARAETWGLVGPGQPLDWLLLTGGLHSTNKVTALAFRPSEAQPAYVVKLPRRRLSLASLEREAEVLRALQARRSRPLAGVPELVFLDTRAEFPAIGETHLSGAPLYTALNPQTKEPLARQAASWLLELVEPGPSLPRSEWWARLADPLLEEFEQGYAAAGFGWLAQALRAKLAGLGDLPRAVEHRDYSPWNLLLTSAGELAVLDWEGAEPDGLPFTDLVYFLAYWTFFAEGALEPDAPNGAAPAAYLAMLDPHTAWGAFAAALMQEYAQKVGLPAGALPALRCLTWLRHAVLEKRLIENSSAGAPDPQLLASGLHLALLRTEWDLRENA